MAQTYSHVIKHIKHSSITGLLHERSWFIENIYELPVDMTYINHRKTTLGVTT